MDITEEIKSIFDELKNALPKSKKTSKLLDDNYEKIIEIICTKNKNTYYGLIQQMTFIPITNLVE